MDCFKGIQQKKVHFTSRTVDDRIYTNIISWEKLHSISKMGKVLSYNT